MRSHWIGVGGTDPMTGVFIGEREEDLDAETQGRDSVMTGMGISDETTSQGMPGIPANNTKIGEARKGSSLDSSEETWVC